LPSNVRWGASQGGVPSASTSSVVCQKQCFRLSEDVGHENVVMPADGIQGLSKYDEVAGDEPGSLVDELIKKVLPLCLLPIVGPV